MQRRLHFIAPAILVAAAIVACGDDAPTSGSGITCGAGTTLNGQVCVAATGTSSSSSSSSSASSSASSASSSSSGTTDGGGITCGSGTVLRGNQCVLPSNAVIKSARLTYLNVPYDLTKPILLDHPLLIRFGITSNSADNKSPVTTPVTVTFSFVEANPADPANPKTCASGGERLKLVGNGTEQRFEAKVVPSTHFCTFITASTKVNLAVGFDLALEKTPTGIDYPAVTFSAAAAAKPDNQLCRTSPDAASPTGQGCVYALSVAPPPNGADGKPLVNVDLVKLEPESSVALLAPAGEDPQVPNGKREDDEPAILVGATLVLDGRDPYKQKINPALIPADYIATHPDVLKEIKFGLDDTALAALDDLPAATSGGASAVIRYDIVAKSKIAPTAWLPLMIDDPKNPDPDGLLSEIALSELTPGAESNLTHGLYIKGAALAAVSPGGPWVNDDEFTVRGCVVSNFPEAENAGDSDSDPAIGGDVPNGDCKTFNVRLVKSPRPAPAANAQTFDMSWSRSIGDPDSVQLTGGLSTSNTLDLSGARSESQAFVDLRGKIGEPFSTRLFNARARAGSFSQIARTNIDVGIDIFGDNVFSYQNTAPDASFTRDFKLAKSFQFPILGHSFGAATIGITAGVGGEAGISPSLSVKAQTGGDSSVPELASAVASGTVNGGVTITAALTGNLTGGIDLFIAAGKIVAEVTFIQATSPINANMKWGVTSGTADAPTAMTVVGSATWDLNLSWLNVKIDGVGHIIGIPATENFYKFENTPETLNLMNRSIPVTVLQ